MPCTKKNNFDGKLLLHAEQSLADAEQSPTDAEQSLADAGQPPTDAAADIEFVKEYFGACGLANNVFKILNDSKHNMYHKDICQYLKKQGIRQRDAEHICNAVVYPSNFRNLVLKSVNDFLDYYGLSEQNCEHMMANPTDYAFLTKELSLSHEKAINILYVTEHPVVFYSLINRGLSYPFVVICHRNRHHSLCGILSNHILI